jgi:hypothetical protein
MEADIFESLLRYLYTGKLDIREMDIEFMLSLHNAGFHFHQLKKNQNFPFILKIAYKNEKKIPFSPTISGYGA